MSNFISENKKLLKILLSLTNAFLLSLIILAAFGIIGIIGIVKHSSYVNKTINVSGEGVIYASPDLAVINFSIINESKSAADALKINKKKANKVISLLKGKKIKEKDIKTISFNIYPRYEWRKTEANQYGKRVLAGYEAKQIIEVKIRNLSDVGKIIQEAVSNGANQVGNIDFSIEDKDKLIEEAREKAINKAKGKAKILAKSLGVKLKKVINYYENSAQPLESRYYGLNKVDSFSKGSQPLDIEKGSNKIRVFVTITYEID